MMRSVFYTLAVVLFLCGCSQPQVQKTLLLKDLRLGMPLTEIQEYLTPVDEGISAAGIEGSQAAQMRQYRVWVRGTGVRNATVSGSVQSDMVPYLLTFEVMPPSDGTPEQSRLIKAEVDEAAVAERNRQIEYMEDKTDAYREKQLEEFRKQTEAARRQAIYQRNQLP